VLSVVRPSSPVTGLVEYRAQWLRIPWGVGVPIGCRQQGMLAGYQPACGTCRVMAAYWRCCQQPGRAVLADSPLPFHGVCGLCAFPCTLNGLTLSSIEGSCVDGDASWFGATIQQPASCAQSQSNCWQQGIKYVMASPWASLWRRQGGPPVPLCRSAAVLLSPFVWCIVRPAIVPSCAVPASAGLPDSGLS
jgi:hypothetical protein